MLALLPAGLGWWRIFWDEWGLETFVAQRHGGLSVSAGAHGRVSAVLTALVLFYSMVLTVMRCMKALIAANVCGIVAAYALVCGAVHSARWELQGTTYAAIAGAGWCSLCFWAVSALRAGPQVLCSTAGPLPKPEDPFDGLPS